MNLVPASSSSHYLPKRFGFETREALIEKPQDDRQFLVLSLIFCGFAFFNKYAPTIERFYRDPRNQAIFGVVVLGLLILALVEASSRLSARKAKLKAIRDVIAETDDSVFCGVNKEGQEVHLKPSQRGMHAQVVGTTNAGKTESVILPWAIQDIAHGRGLLIIDGKADRGLLDKLYAYCSELERADDFRLFSLSNLEDSNQFNPLIGGSPEEIAERVFNSFDIEHPYYRAVQFEVLVQTLRVFEELKIVPTFERLFQAVTDPMHMADEGMKLSSIPLKEWLAQFVKLPEKDRSERTSGLLSALGQFAFGRHSDLFRTLKPDLDIADALENGKIVYFQLPVLLSPFLGKAVGKLVLQTLQAAIANRHRSLNKDQEFFSVFLDDFTEYLYPGFVSILNKSRSAKVGVVFAHQALGDIEGLGQSVANSILTNSNIKVFMRGSDPQTAEYFSRVIGTRTTTKTTERAKKAIVGHQTTGDQSVREVEEFIIHPNKFKSHLGVGEAYLVIPHGSGSRTEFVKLQMWPDQERREIPKPQRTIASPLVRKEPPASASTTAPEQVKPFSTFQEGETTCASS